MPEHTGAPLFPTPDHHNNHPTTRSPKATSSAAT